jgi:hypothetical protein
VQLLVGVDHPLHLGDRWQRIATGGVGGQQPGLAFHEREQRRDRLREANEHRSSNPGLNIRLYSRIWLSAH